MRPAYVPYDPLRPLVLLDVDGVINALFHRDRNEDDAHTMTVRAFGSQVVQVAAPGYMPDVIQGLVAHNDVVWCTAWHEDANVHIGPWMGIDWLPRVYPLPGRSRLGTFWKPDGARSWVADAISVGRRVVWIEDFDGRLPHGSPFGHPNVAFVDTLSRHDQQGVLRPYHLDRVGLRWQS